MKGGKMQTAHTQHQTGWNTSSRSTVTTTQSHGDAVSQAKATASATTQPHTQLPMEQKVTAGSS